MRNKKLKLALSDLEKEMEVISREEMKSFKGGGNPNTSCVFETMAMLSSGHHSADYFRDKYNEMYGCNSSTGTISENGCDDGSQGFRIVGNNFDKIDEFFSEFFEIQKTDGSDINSLMSNGYKVAVVVDTDYNGTPDHMGVIDHFYTGGGFHYKTGEDGRYSTEGQCFIEVKSKK